MRVGVHEARHQDMVRSLVTGARSVAALGVGERQHIDDTARIHREREPRFGDHGWLDAYGPSRTDQSVDRLHRVLVSSEKGEQV